MEVTAALASLGGVGRTRQLLALGCSAFALRKAVDLGTVLQVSRGAYALPTAPPDAVLAVTLCAGVTCVSALQALGLPLFRPPTLPHLAVARNFTPDAWSATRARLHYDAARPAPGAIASAARALDVAGACLDETWHLVAVDAALNRGMITLGDVLGFKRSTRERRDFLLRFADARSQSPGETIARLRVVQAGFRVCPQAYIEGAGHVDLEVEGILILQVDGYEPHSDRGTFRRDREKGRAVIKAGRPQLSYAASELLGYSTADVVGDVREALARWKARDIAGIRPSGRRVLRIQRDARGG